jgi:hypothetical protein
MNITLKAIMPFAEKEYAAKDLSAELHSWIL